MSIDAVRCAEPGKETVKKFSAWLEGQENMRIDNSVSQKFSVIFFTNFSAFTKGVLLEKTNKPCVRKMLDYLYKSGIMSAEEIAFKADLPVKAVKNYFEMEGIAC